MGLFKSLTPDPSPAEKEWKQIEQRLSPTSDIASWMNDDLGDGWTGRDVHPNLKLAAYKKATGQRR